VAANRAFAEKMGFPYQLLSDTDRKVGLAYGACDAPTAATARRISYLIDPQGVIQGAWGTGGKLDVRAHAGEVLTAIG
jgi:peroxiredoxin Q/BCP